MCAIPIAIQKHLADYKRFVAEHAWLNRYFDTRYVRPRRAGDRLSAVNAIALHGAYASTDAIGQFRILVDCQATQVEIQCPIGADRIGNLIAITARGAFYVVKTRRKSISYRHARQIAKCGIAHGYNVIDEIAELHHVTLHFLLHDQPILRFDIQRNIQPYRPRKDGNLK